MAKVKPLIRISLSENDFKLLVSGKIIRPKEKYANIEIVLQDIGFALMRECITFAELEQM